MKYLTYREYNILLPILIVNGKETTVYSDKWSLHLTSGHHLYIQLFAHNNPVSATVIPFKAEKN